MSLTIRQADLADIETIVDFNCRLALETEGKSLDKDVVTAGVAAALEDSHKGPYFLAEEGGQILGQLQITYEWSDWRNGWIWWIQGVYVRAEARRQGVFRALYRHIEHMGRLAGNVIGLRLYVERQNHRAQKTYQDLGMSLAEYLMLEKFPI